MNERVWPRVYKAVINLSNDLTTHGVSKIINKTNWIVRCLWSLLVLTSASFCIFFIAKGFLQYYKYDVTTTIRIINDFVPEFPSVTICNKNPFTSKIAVPLFNNVSLTFYNMTLDELTAYLKSSISVREKKQLIDEFLVQVRLTAFQSLTISEKMSSSFTLKDFMFNCVFGVVYCKHFQFDWYYHSTYGSCYVFNNGRSASGSAIDIFSTKREGRIDGLSIEAFVGVTAKLEPFVSGYGLIIKVQNRTYLPYDMSSVEAAAGRETSIAITKTMVYQQPAPYSKCTVINGYIDENPDTLYNMITKSNYSYTQQYCIDLCLQALNIDQCNCYNQMYPWLEYMVKGVEPCFSSTKRQKCSQTFNFMNRNEDFIMTNCQSQCPLECNRVDYQNTVTFSHYPTNEYADYTLKRFEIIKLSEQESSALLNKSVLKVNVYFDSLVYTQIIETPSQTFASLFSNMGGTMGLFLGMSFLSLFELLEMLLTSFFIWRENKQPFKKS